MYGARTSLIVGVVASGIAVLIGLIVGMIAGYFRGWADTVLSRVGRRDARAAAAPDLDRDRRGVQRPRRSGCLRRRSSSRASTLVIVVIVLFTWPYIARLVRGFTLSLREKEFVEASRSLGASNFRIIIREILPNLAGPMIVYTTLLIPQSILFEAALSYLGLGVPPEHGLVGRRSSTTRSGSTTSPGG